MFYCAKISDLIFDLFCFFDYILHVIYNIITTIDTGNLGTLTYFSLETLQYGQVVRISVRNKVLLGINITQNENIEIQKRGVVPQTETDFKIKEIAEILPLILPKTSLDLILKTHAFSWNKLSSIVAAVLQPFTYFEKKIQQIANSDFGGLIDLNQQSLEFNISTNDQSANQSIDITDKITDKTKSKVVKSKFETYYESDIVFRIMYLIRNELLKIENTDISSLGQILVLFPDVATLESLYKYIEADLDKLSKDFNHAFVLNSYTSSGSIVTNRRTVLNCIGSKNTQIILTTRSGIFLPFTMLTKTILIEESNNNLIQDQNSLYFDARDISYILSQIWGCELDWVSHFPSSRSLAYKNIPKPLDQDMQNAESEQTKKMAIGKSTSLNLENTNLKLDLKTLEQISSNISPDLSNEIKPQELISDPDLPEYPDFISGDEFDFHDPNFKTSKPSIQINQKNSAVDSNHLFSAATETNIEAASGPVLFIHPRRGNFRITQCGSCRHIWYCPNCTAALITYKNADFTNTKKLELICHHCQTKAEYPNKCPECASLDISSYSSGIDDLAEFLEKTYLEKVIFKIETATKKQMQTFQSSLSSTSPDSTQSPFYLTSKVFDPRIDYSKFASIVIIQAQNLATGVDYLTTEEVYLSIYNLYLALGQSPTSLIFDTTSPELEILQKLLLLNHTNQNFEAIIKLFEGFMTSELVVRKTFHLPPYQNLLLLSLSGKDHAKLKSNIGVFYKWLKEATLDLQPELEIVAPYPAKMLKRQGMFTYHCLLKYPKNFKHLKTLEKIIKPKIADMHMQARLNPRHIF